VDFMERLRSDEELASYFGLLNDIHHENGTLGKYDRMFESIDYDHMGSINVNSLTPKIS
jgi:hypothetical protein